MKRVAFLLPLLLLGCGTPQEQCIAAGTRDLRAVEKLIAEAETNLKRGYALEKETVWTTRWVHCAPPPPPPPQPGQTPPPPPRPQMCLEDVPETVTRPVAIDLAAEKRKLAQLQDKRAELLKAAEAVAAECRAKYPE